jgi:multidrug efflux pump subunit AcrA (membrane-fusion protein)
MNLLAPHSLFVTAATLALCSCGPDQAQAAAQGADMFVVKRDKLRIAIKENAELAAAVETRVRSEMEGQNTVIFLVKEGTRVNKGDKLVELDASQVIEKRATQEIQVARARASLVSAEKAEEIQIKQNEAEMLGAQNELKIALMGQEKFLGRGSEGQRQMGEREQKTRDADDSIKLAEQERKLAVDRLEWSKKLHAKEFITKNELERDELDAERKRYQVQRAQNEKVLLQDYDLEIQQIEVEQKVVEAKLALERVQAQGDAKLAQAKAEVDSSRAELKLAVERLENLERQVKNAIILAPTPGLVVYSFEGDGMRRREVVEEGSNVRERQALIILPDITRMVANLSVHEAMVDKVKVGQPALVRIDANSDQVFTGRVASVSALADSSQRSFNPTTKVYKTSVALDGENLPLRPNMTATCEIVISEHDAVLFVPMQAVQRQGAVSYAWVAGPAGPEARVLELGVNDYSYVIVKNGVNEGARVYLTAPPGAQAPEFAQPKEPRPTSPAPQSTGPDDSNVANGVGREGQAGERGREGQGREGQGRDGQGRDGQGRGRRGSSPQMTAFREAFAKKHPDLAALAESDRSAFMTNEDIKRAIDEDPELKQMWEAVMSSFRGMGRGRRGGEGGGGDGNGNGNGNASGNGERPRASEDQGNK